MRQDKQINPEDELVRLEDNKYRYNISEETCDSGSQDVIKVESLEMVMRKADLQEASGLYKSSNLEEEMNSFESNYERKIIDLYRVIRIKVTTTQKKKKKK